MTDQAHPLTELSLRTPGSAVVLGGTSRHVRTTSVQKTEKEDGGNE